MVTGLERITISVPELQVASEDYRTLLGVEFQQVDLEGVRRRWFALSNTTIELVETAGTEAEIRGLLFRAVSASERAAAIDNKRGLDISVCSGAPSAPNLRESGICNPDGLRVDHLVLRTASAEDCIDLFTERLGIRLALDKTVPEWGGRMLFFRTGKLTLEVIESTQENPEKDYFWGIAYQCADLAKLALALSARGVSLSDIRDGRKPGSRVATVKSHCLGIPTLLLQPPS